SGLTADNDFSSPDGLYFDQRGLLWIQTDDGAYRDTVNNQMLVAIPGEVGDGGMLTFTNDFGAEENTTFVGKDASAV
ncbi:alkaline phosphatase PhoX, partial [Alcanivorax jadensis]